VEGRRRRLREARLLRRRPGDWTFARYPLDAVLTSTDWVGLSEITLLPGAGSKVAIERVNAIATGARVKRVCGDRVEPRGVRLPCDGRVGEADEVQLPGERVVTLPRSYLDRKTGSPWVFGGEIRRSAGAGGGVWSGRR